MKTRALFLAAASALMLFLPASLPCSAQTTRADAEKDPVLSAMLQELGRSRDHLQLPGFQKPFFIQYRLDDVVDYTATANYGSLTGEQESHRRVVRVTVRVGDYKTDSSTERGDGSLQFAAIEDDPIALRYALWSATDLAYKNALREYTQKQAELKTVQTPPQADDFSSEKPVISIDPEAKLVLDREAWKQRIVDASALYRTDPQAKAFSDDTQYSSGSVRARALNRYLVNTEGTIVRQGSSEYLATVSLGTQASDGMRIDRSYGTTSAAADGLDSAQKFHDGVVKVLLSLHDLKNAPVISDEYHGPVLFSADASSDIFAELFAPAVAAQRPEMGTTQRTRGPYASSFQARVLPDFLKVTDNPGLTSFDNKPLLGAYQVDDEGVAAQPVTLVESGRLTNYLIGREPVKDFPASNGHARAGIAQPARPITGVLHVETASPATSDELMKKLLALGKDDGLQYVYRVETFGPQLTPRLLWRIQVADGKKELVRGAALDDLDQRTLRADIRAAGSDTWVDNIFGDVPQTVLAPSILIEDVTVKRADDRNDKLPYYSPPADK
ncbi:metallopeptidase TldD-related protein [Paracidobacterium acidisoli]|uniref:Peptidase U62 n=1 Tax=Paracidobacterium acidisoli TaxID=2303751 RepID=A0A372IME0_9BACT|nr:metallopeptidase TldD-related protein [Paracidobacterium acidisoli]MBT9331658.1 peptidase U62 [Paracidobacterium acidisoli]